MNIKMTQDISEANLVTHNGTFHADEVMATVIFGKLLGEITVCRVDKVPENLIKTVLVYDIGGGRFDHHQKGGNGSRVNGVPYASCGLVWRVYGPILVGDIPNSYGIWKAMDKIIFQGIDAVDNATMPAVDYPAYSLSISQMISSFNPTWDSDESADKAFVKAVLFAETVFDNEFNQLVSKERGRSVVEEAIDKVENHIMILEKYVSWQRTVLWSRNEKAQDIYFVIYPSNRIGYTWHGVPEKFGQAKLRKSVPVEWRGLEGEKIQKVSGVKTAIFCHNDGFIGSAETLEDTVKMVEIAIKS